MEVKRRTFMGNEGSYITVVGLTSKDDKKFTVELFSDTAEDAYVKEMAVGKIFGEREDIKAIELIGTYKRVTLKVIGE